MKQITDNTVQVGSSIQTEKPDSALSKREWWLKKQWEGARNTTPEERAAMWKGVDLSNMNHYPIINTHFGHERIEPPVIKRKSFWEKLMFWK